MTDGKVLFAVSKDCVSFVSFYNSAFSAPAEGSQSGDDGERQSVHIH